MASRFWVGGTGTWNNSSTANWASTSGGAPGASAPTSVDNVFFDSNSGTAAVVSVASTAAANAVTINKSDIELKLTGSPSFSSNIGLTTGHLNLDGNTITITVFNSSNTNARTLTFGGGKMVLTGSGTTILNCADLTNLTVSGTPVFEWNYSGSVGTRTGNWGATAGGNEANAATARVTAGSDIASLNAAGHYKNNDYTGFSGTAAIGFTNYYGSLTLSATMTQSGNGALVIKPTSGSYTFTWAGQTIDRPITVSAPGATLTFTDALTQGSTRAFTFTAGTLKLKNGVTSTVGAFATSGTTAKTLQSASAGAVATLSQASGTVNASYMTVQDIAATGGAVWNAFLTNNNFDNGGNSGWNFGLSPGNTVEFSPALRSFTERKHF